MTYVMESAACVWMLALILEAWPPRYGAPLWTLPPLPTLGHVGATERQRIGDDISRMLASTIPLVTLAGQLAEDAATLDGIEAKLSEELAWLEASVTLWLGGDQLTEHALISLTDQGYGSEACPALIGAVLEG